MEDLTELQAKLHRVQAEIEKSAGHLAKQRALIADRLADGADVAQFCDLLVTLEDTHLIHVQHRDRLRRKLDRAFAGMNGRLTGLRGPGESYRAGPAII
jgi:multidrug resistance efflux pump